MLVRFTKMHGIGNDFMMLDLISQSIQLTAAQIQELADRRMGVGFDQLLTVEPPTDPDKDFLYRIYNADGSEAEQCGNGARCFLRFVRDRGLTTKTSIDVQTSTGSIQSKLEKDGNVTVNMGRPVLNPTDIPFVSDKACISYPLNLPPQGGEQDESIQVTPVSMGNPHAVIQVDRIADAPVSRIAPKVQQHSSFPNQANVGFMQIVSASHIRLRVYERGVGETLACGSGACAAVVAGRLQGLLREQVLVELPGGNLTINWAGDHSPVMLTGPVCRVYEGRFQI